MKDLGARSAETGRGALVVGDRDGWELYDERTGTLLGRVDTQVTAAARLGERTIVSTGHRAPQTIQELGGTTLGTVDDSIGHVLAVGAVVLLASYEWRITPLRSGRTLWRAGASVRRDSTPVSFICPKRK